MKLKVRRAMPVVKLKRYPSQLKAEWKSLGRRAVRLWKESGGVDPEIDALFRRMDAVDRALAKTPEAKAVRRRQRAVEAR